MCDKLYAEVGGGGGIFELARLNVNEEATSNLVQSWTATYVLSSDLILEAYAPKIDWKYAMQQKSGRF